MDRGAWRATAAGVAKEWDTTEQRSTYVYPVHRTTHSRPARQRPSSKRFGLQRPACGQLPPLSSWASLCISTLTGQGACQGHKSRRIRIALTWRRGSSEVRWAAGLYQACSTRFCHSQAPSLSWVQLLATPWTAAHQAPLSMGFPRQEYRSGLPFPSPGDLPDPGTESASPALAGGFFTTESPGKTLVACCSLAKSCSTLCEPIDCRKPNFPVLHHLQELAQSHVH